MEQGMSTRYLDGCTCTHRRCHVYHAPELLCRGALASLHGMHAQAQGEAEAAGDTAKASEEQNTVTFLQGMLTRKA